MKKRKTVIDKSFFVAIGIVLLLLVLLVTIFFSRQQQQTQQHAAGTGKFQVLGNKIVDPNGNRFIVKGMNDLFGIWDGQNVGQYGSLQYQYAQRDFAIMKGMGINYLRMWTSTQIMTNTTWQSQLDHSISLAEQQGFVVEVTCACDTGQDTVSFMQYLANRYKADPYVWIEPVNEPNCSGSGPCNNWNSWHSEWSQFIQAIRGQGFQNPIIIQTPWWSARLNQYGNPAVSIDTPGYTFSDTNLIYSVHEYALNNVNSWTASDAQDQDNWWSNYATNHAIIVDEFGPQNTGAACEIWVQGFLDYVANWVNNRNGSGAVGFLWFWMSGDSMTGTDLGNYSNGSTLDQWGNEYKTRYLDKVESSGGTSPTLASSVTPTQTVIPSPNCLGPCPTLALKSIHYQVSPAIWQNYTLPNTINGSFPSADCPKYSTKS